MRKIWSSVAENEYCSGIETWHGDNDIATVVNQAGNQTNESLMFDSNNNTYWHSDINSQNNLKIIGVEFKVSSFEFLIMTKLMLYNIGDLTYNWNYKV